MDALFSFFQYGFAVRALEAGVVVGFVAPLIGIFIVLRRLSLIADTFAHVSFAGIALGLTLGIHPLAAALGATLVAALGIERLRASGRVYGESALAIFLSGSLALAVVLMSTRGVSASAVFGYLFGSITTASPADIRLVALLGAVVVCAVVLFYKELLYVTFDEEAAAVSGIPVGLVNAVLMGLAASTVALAIPIVGVLLISSLMIIPVAAALQFRQSFGVTLAIAEAISVGSVVAGILVSFALNVATGGAIVLVMIAVFAILLALTRPS